MRVVDTSLVVRATTTTDTRERARLQDVILESPAAISHVLAEAYSTLTRLPQPFRLSPRACFTFLSSAFHSQPLTLSADGYLKVLRRVADRGIPGGAIFDCLIAETAREHDATLLSLDERAASSYALMGTKFELL